MRTMQRPDRFSRLAFACCFLLSAYLLFLLQPVMGRLLLPVYGGAPAVWSTCLLFFQALLFLGYAYAHLIASRLSARNQVVAHLVVVAAALLTLPIQVRIDSEWVPSRPPIVEILLLLSVRAGPAFFALSATNPLLQAWYARCGGAPYRFFALSNAGSLAALLSYPFLIEPRLSLDAQGRSWSCGFGAFALAMVFSAYYFLRGAGRRQNAVEGSAADRIDWKSALCWIALSALPSALLIAVTNHITLNVAAVPYLWVTPLALYLLTFIMSFWSDRVRGLSLVLPLWILSIAGAAFSLLAGGRAPFGLQLSLLLACLWFGALICHGTLAGQRPEAGRLTGYYLCITGGGAIGGLFAAIVAPLAFSDYLELPIIILGICVLLPLVASGDSEPERRGSDRRWLWLGLGFGAVAMTAVLWVEIRSSSGNERIVDRARGFFGVARVTETKDAVYLTLGDIQHGMQLRSHADRDLPTSYFGPESGAGLALLRHRAQRPRRIAIIGLGVGTLAAYGKAGDNIRFFELDPNVARFARRRFTYIERSKARVSIEIGDGRLLLDREKGRFDIVVLDAFSSNAVPVHLLTEEAFGLYLSKLAPDGILSVNVTNRHLDVARVVQGSANAFGLTLELVETPPDPERGLKRARWALIAREASALEPILDGVKTGPSVAEPVLWTDRESALWTLVK
jgi:hypothetical protein